MKTDAGADGNPHRTQRYFAKLIWGATDGHEYSIYFFIIP